MRRIIFMKLILALMSACSDKPYVESNIKRQVLGVTEIAIESPDDRAFRSAKTIEVTGTVNEGKHQQDLLLKFRGLDETNKQINGKRAVVLNSDFTEWSVALGEELPQGKYLVSVFLVDSAENESLVDKRTITLDYIAPQILGANDGVAQGTYLQQTKNYRQDFLDDESNWGYRIVPQGDHLPIHLDDIPTFDRWLIDINNEHSAPTLRFQINDESNIADVRYRINEECSTFEDAKRATEMVEGQVEIKITQNNSEANLTRAQGQKYCLSLWAKDIAGNISNRNVKFIWSTVVPPVAIAMNSKKYKAHSPHFS